MRSAPVTSTSRCCSSSIWSGSGSSSLRSSVLRPGGRSGSGDPSPSSDQITASCNEIGRSAHEPSPTTSTKAARRSGAPCRTASAPGWPGGSAIDSAPSVRRPSFGVARDDRGQASAVRDRLRRLRAMPALRRRRGTAGRWLPAREKATSSSSDSRRAVRAASIARLVGVSLRVGADGGVARWRSSSDEQLPPQHEPRGPSTAPTIRPGAAVVRCCRPCSHGPSQPRPACLLAMGALRWPDVPARGHR